MHCLCYFKRMKHGQLDFFATTAKGMEPLLKEELLHCGATDLHEAIAGISFKGSLECGYRACLWSRTASRILLVQKTIKACNAQELYDGIKSIHWDEHLSIQTTFAVSFSASQSQLQQNNQLSHTHFAALKVKDAIVDQMRESYGDRPSIDPVNPDVRINVYLHDNKAIVSIDLSGESLHRRGYREQANEAPLKENLAAAMVLLSEWRAEPGKDFIDPMCGSGTLVLEAALVASNKAPGLLRRSFGFMRWRGHVPSVWNKLVTEAEEQVIKDPKKLPLLSGFDKDKHAIAIAKANLAKAGLGDFVTFKVQDLSLSEPTSEKGILMTNPPYGERMGEVEKLKSLYRQLGDLLKHRFKGWDAYIFTSSPDLAKAVGLRTARRFVLFNGALECRLLKYNLY